MIKVANSISASKIPREIKDKDLKDNIISIPGYPGNYTQDKSLNLKKGVPPSHESSGPSFMKSIFGCQSCMFFDTTDCPHFPEVRTMWTESGVPQLITHANGLCIPMKDLAIDWFTAYKAGEFNLSKGNPAWENHNVITLHKARQIKQLMENLHIETKLKRQALNSFKQGVAKQGATLESLQWAKLNADTLQKMIHHEEGSKVEVNHNRADSLRDVLGQAKTIDAEIVGNKNGKDDSDNR